MHSSMTQYLFKTISSHKRENWQQLIKSIIQPEWSSLGQEDMESLADETRR